MKYFGGCDVGSTYGKSVVLDENGTIVGSSIVRSKISALETAKLALAEAIAPVEGLNNSTELAYLVGTGYGSGIRSQEEKEGIPPVYDFYAEDLVKAAQWIIEKGQADVR